MDEKYLHLWGKLNDERETHALIYHFIDTIEVARQLWHSGFLSDIFKNTFMETYGIGEEWFIFLAASHDFGKITPEFQVSPSYNKSLNFIKDRINKYNIACVDGEFTRGVHEQVGAALVKDSLFQYLKRNNYIKNSKVKNLLQLAVATNVSQGLLLHNSEIVAPIRSPRITASWDIVFNDFIQVLLDYCKIDKSSLILQELPSWAVHTLAGVIKVSDWLASNPYYFKFYNNKSVEDYSVISVKAAERIVWDVKLCRPVVKNNISLSDVIGYNEPHSMQITAYEHAKDSPRGSLTVIQAETGGGKTLAALGAAYKKIQDNNLYGVYMAMPTKITSLQAFREVANWCDRTFEGNIKPHLEMGNWNDAFTDEKDYSPTVSKWLRGPRRNLLSPVSVGTVDQLFQSFQRRKYQSSRIAGLSNRVIIFDEVHSYDVFQRKHLLTTLEWLSAMKIPVIILTATLTDAFKTDIIKAYSKITNNDNFSTDSMAITTVSSDDYITVTNIPNVRNRDVALSFIKCGIMDRTDHIIKEVDTLLLEADGKPRGIIGIVKNTVDSAIDTAEDLIRYYPNARVILLHSRFTLRDRALHEEELLKYVGKGAKDDRASNGLIFVVGTQIIEQSLDIDFDLLFSDAAPIDSLIQRIGRLHRWDNINRPSWAIDPHCYIFHGDTLINSLKNEGLYKYIAPRSYIASIDVLSTLYGNDNKNNISLPEHISPVLEDVDEWTTTDVDLGKYITRESDSVINRVNKAEQMLLPSPKFASAWRNLEVDRVVTTRDGVGSVNIVLAESDGHGGYRAVSDSNANFVHFDADLFVFRQSSLSLSYYMIGNFKDNIIYPVNWENTVLSGYGLLVVGNLNNEFNYSYKFGFMREK